jgi:hypothetical protein
LLLRQQHMRRMIEATTVSSMDGGTDARGPTAADERKEQVPADDSMQAMEAAAGRGPQPAPCRSEAKLGPTLSGVDAPSCARAAAAPADRRRRHRRLAGRRGRRGDARSAFQLK